jgi:hypothetical protein
MAGGFASVFRAFFFDVAEVLVEYDTIVAGQHHETLAAGASDQSQVGLAGKLDAPCGEARAGYEDWDSHAHGLDDHLARQAPGRIKDLVRGLDAMPEHPARDLVDRIVAADVLQIDQRPILVREHAAVDGARFEIERRRRVDPVRERVKPRGAQLGVRQARVIDHLHQVAEHGALSAARRLHFLPELLFEVGGALGAHDDHRKLFVVVDARDDVVGPQHVLVEQIAERQVFRVVVDGHRCHDLLRVEEDREGPLDNDRGLGRRTGVIDAAHPLGQAAVIRIGTEQVAVLSVLGRVLQDMPTPLPRVRSRARLARRNT